MITMTRRGLLTGVAAITATAAIATTSGTPVAFAATAREAYFSTTSSAANIRALQYALTAYGIQTSADGSYGPGTTASVKTFQSRSGLTADGSAGPATTQKLLGGSNMAAKYGWTNTSTNKAVQTLLVANGQSVPVDGSFGPSTRTAVETLQSRFGLASTGTVDWITWTYLINPPTTGSSGGLRKGPVTLVSQAATGLASWAADCGPTSFLMLELRLGLKPYGWSNRATAISYIRHTILGMNNDSRGTSQIGVTGIVNGFRKVGVSAGHGGVADGTAAVRAGGVAMQQGRLDVAYSWQGVSKKTDEYHWVALLDYNSSNGTYLVGDPSSQYNKLVWVTQAQLTQFGASAPDSVYVR